MDIDSLILGFDRALRTIVGQPQTTGRNNPATDANPSDLSEAEANISAGLMRVNHSGEVCAQALYQGQALTARNKKIKAALEHAADEENDHLEWCEQRVRELGSHTSYLNPLLYAGSFALGAASGLVGDRWSLGFLAETERQVGRHLDSHLQQIPGHDDQSRAVLIQMQEDEARHATTAVEHGAVELPEPIRQAMTLSAKVMTTLTRII
ncbi:MAG TPA: 2-polyprenyl-3-methyl-6-methoxy-1,4-benzoquinone monooxygenase [Chromatiaceae bacterium]|jgi:ubiquinone biosynthesis monooxygenase Coq7|nr:2-polyprenyl-3-methyl-6-methoxy-1,4-benzoquinone monooxygenase [Chromatiaceae bacterium]